MKNKTLKNKSILKARSNGSLYIDAKDLFSNEKVIETLKQLKNSTIYEQIRENSAIYERIRKEENKKKS